MNQGLFITLEGIEGAGKSSLLPFITEYFSKRGREVVQTREPGGTETGEGIRAILLAKENNTLTDNTELLLIFAARMQHIEQVIRPALASGKVVLSDRFIDASYAYQGAGRGLNPSRIEVLEEWVQQELKPDLTFLLDLDVELGLRRANNRSEADRFEQEDVSFFQRIRACYLDRANNEPDRFRIINAAQALPRVTLDIQTILEEYRC